jgi:SAM-dependent methyltransferase
VPDEGKLSRRYTGSTAESYDRDRLGTPRDVAEQGAIRQLLAEASPTTVLDSPCGTGRFFPAYLDGGVTELTGIDVSGDMLEIAARRAEELSLSAHFHRASLLDHDSLPNPDPVDMVCCIRFLNWISWAQAIDAVTLLRPFAARHMIVGVTTQDSPPPRLRAAKQWLTDAARPNRGPRIHVHRPAQVSELFAQLELSELRRIPTFNSEGRTNHLYLLRA